MRLALRPGIWFMRRAHSPVRISYRLLLVLAGVLASGVRASDAAYMCVDPATIAHAPLSSQEPSTGDVTAAVLTPPPVVAKSPSRFSLNGQKFGAPLTRRTEAGVSWALDSHVSIQLNYARTAQAPMMPFDHDDGIMTRLRVGF